MAPRRDTTRKQRRARNQAEHRRRQVRAQARARISLETSLVIFRADVRGPEALVREVARGAARLAVGAAVAVGTYYAVRGLYRWLYWARRRPGLRQLGAQ